MPTKIEKDAARQAEAEAVRTTGHEWDGIYELDTPLPKWWVYLFIACVVFAGVYALLYPSIPYGRGYMHGILGYSSRDSVNAEVAAVDKQRAVAMGRIAVLPFEKIEADPELREVAEIAGRTAFANDCQPCHGAGGAGRPGYPALAAGAWIWGGHLEDLQATITHGIRSSDPEARESDMPRFGADRMLTKAQIQQVADYVWTHFYGHSESGVDTAPGEKLFADNCAPCHGDHGQGEREVGAPRLASHVHLYGDARETIVAQIVAPHEGIMPNWNKRLDPGTIKSLALYVHGLGGGE